VGHVWVARQTLQVPLGLRKRPCLRNSSNSLAAAFLRLSAQQQVWGALHTLGTQSCDQGKQTDRHQQRHKLTLKATDVKTIQSSKNSKNKRTKFGVEA